MGRSVAAGCVILFLLTFTAGATTWYVEPDGTGDVPTIQAAVDTLAPGDTLVLASGVFTGEGNINIVVPDKDFLMKSETGDPEDCIIDCEGHLGWGRRGFHFLQRMSGPAVQGITIRNGNGMGEGGAVYCEGSPQFRSCVFEGNYADYAGGAVSCNGMWASPEFRHCVFQSNEAGVDGGAMYIYGVVMEVTVDSCSFYDNLAGLGGGAICCYQHEAEAWVRNSIFVGNAAMSRGGAIEVVAMAAYIRNCSFCANSSPNGSAICDWTGIWGCSLSDVRNCIIAYGVGGSGYYQPSFCEFDDPLRCTNIYGNEGGDWPDSLALRLGVDGIFSECPSFCNADIEPFDLRLCDGSPCLPGNHPDGYDCGLIGALDEGCVCEPTTTRPSTWGAIKAMYR